MSYHYIERGYSPIVIGFCYSRHHGMYAYKFKLKKYNKDTGICTLLSEGGYSVYVSESKLSNWVIVNKD